MSKARNKSTDVPVEKTSTSTGSRGDSAFQRDQSGNHHGDRARATRIPSNGRSNK